MRRDGYFQDHEITCRCGCGFTLAPPIFLSKVNMVREITGFALIVNSWCRCPAHNRAVGSKPTSSHLKGLAVDLNAPTDYLKYRILLAAGRVGFRGVGVGERFIHLDDDIDKAPDRFWIY